MSNSDSNLKNELPGFRSAYITINITITITPHHHLLVVCVPTHANATTVLGFLVNLAPHCSGLLEKPWLSTIS